MIAENDSIIKKRYEIVSIFMPVVCVLLNFLGLLMSGFERILDIVPELCFTACFSFIFVFFVDLKRDSVLSSRYKVILILAGTGLTFFVSAFMDNFGIALVTILAVALFCAFLNFESALILMVGFIIYIWAFDPEIIASEILVYSAAVLMVCIVMAFSDRINKLVYSLISFTVFYLILNLIFNQISFEKAMNMTVFTIWLYCIAVIICLYFVKNLLADKAYLSNRPVYDVTYFEKRRITEEAGDTSTDIHTDNSGTEFGSPETLGETGKAYDNISGTTEGTDRSYDNVSGIPDESGSKQDISTGTTGYTTDIPGNPNEIQGIPSEAQGNLSETQNYTAETQGNTLESQYTSAETQENHSETQSNAAGIPDNTSELQNTASETQENHSEMPESSGNNDQPENAYRQSNQALFDSIQELSTRLVKLESENSVLQLMLNSSVYDLSTITDPDYPYILKLKEESPKYYKHCLKVARISSEAAALISCDSEEAYAIGMYIKAPKILGDGASSILSASYKVPKNIISAVNKINNKVNANVMTREAGIVMLTDDIINTINYLNSKNNGEVSIERIVNNTIKVRKEQNYLRSAGFTNEEIQLLRLYYNDLGDHYKDPEEGTEENK